MPYGGLFFFIVIIKSKSVKTCLFCALDSCPVEFYKKLFSSNKIYTPPKYPGRNVKIDILVKRVWVPSTVNDNA